MGDGGVNRKTQNPAECEKAIWLSALNQILNQHPGRYDIHFNQWRTADPLRKKQYAAGNPTGRRSIVAAEKRSEVPARPVVSVSDVVPNVPHLGQERAVIQQRADAVVGWINEVLHAPTDARRIIPACVVFAGSVVSFHRGVCSRDRPPVGTLEMGHSSVQIRRRTANFAENDL
jgi:hypothetical protein